MRQYSKVHKRAIVVLTYRFISFTVADYGLVDDLFKV